METYYSENIEVLKHLIAYPTITPKECGIFEYICKLLPDFTPIFLTKEGVSNLFLYKKFKDGVHLCFGGHIDVVPPGDGWNFDPFSPIMQDGCIYGRGSQDMKGGVSSFIAAIRQFEIDSKKNKALATDIGILSILLTSDEEGDAIYGTKLMLEHLKSIELLPDFAIVAEPTSMEIFGDTLKIGRRGSINGVLHIIGKQGHVAYPKKCINPAELLIPILPKLAGYELDCGNEIFEPTKIVITDIRGGIETVNVTPSEIKIMFNIRNSTLTSLQTIEYFLQDLLKDIPSKLLLKQSSKPFLTNISSPLIRSLIRQIETITHRIPTQNCSGGTSDARYFSEFGIDVVEFGVCNDRIHAINERVSIDEVINLTKIFYRLLCDFNVGKG